MAFDWNRERYESEAPKQDRSWRRLAREHPTEFILALLLGVALLMWWGVS